MYDPDAADSDNQDEGQHTDADHPGEDNHQQDDKEKNQYDGWVPRDRFNAALAKERNAVSILRTELDALKKTVERTTAPKTFTKAELDAAVSEGKMSQEKADSVLETQLETKIVEKVAGTVAQATQEQRRLETINQYETAVPALRDEASDAYQRVVQQYNHLVNNVGLPNNNSTMIAALEGVCGPLTALGKGKATSKKVEFEPLSETMGGGGGASGDRGKSKGKAWTDLTPAQRKFCDEAITRGAYTSREDFLTEVNYTLPVAKNEWSLSKQRAASRNA